MADVGDIETLSFWTGQAKVRPLDGGMTNKNFLVEDEAGHYVVRLGEDLAVHHISRANELAASHAAHAAGLSPAIRHSEPGILVMDYVPSKSLKPVDVRNPEKLPEIIKLVQLCHRRVPDFLKGAAAIFWVYHVVRDYGWTLRDSNSPHLPKLSLLLAASAQLEAASGPFDIVFGHNDLLCGNFLDDGKRLWLIDWDYAGFNTPLFDLGGLASNNEFPEVLERQMLELYYEAPVTDELWRRYTAMKCASLLRETMWSMVSELHSSIAFDYASYTAENLARFERVFADFQNS